MKETHGVTYFTASEASQQLSARHNFRVQVEEWWQELGAGTPPIEKVQGGSRGVIARHVATFRYEDEVFVRMAKEAGLEPTWLEYLGDRFTTVAPVKLALLHRFLFEGVGRAGGHKIRKEVLANPKHWDGRPLQDIVLTNGQKMIQFHHTWQEQMYPQAQRADFSAWLWHAGKSSGLYYELYLSLFLAHYVLFEDYHGGESGGRLDNFTKRVFEQAYQALRQRFGIAPLIVPLPWWNGLQYYPATAAHREILPPPP